jgi:hypothetical protein
MISATEKNISCLWVVEEIVHCVDLARARARERETSRASDRTRVELAERKVELAMEWTEWVELAEICLEFGFNKFCPWNFVLEFEFHNFLVSEFVLEFVS